MFVRFVCLIASAGLACTAAAAELKVLAPNAAREPVIQAVAVFEQATGQQVKVSWSGTEAITRRIAEGEAADVVINAVQNIERQAQDGTLVAASCTDFARVGIGVAVPAAAASLEVSTPEAMRAGLLSARSVIVSSGTSGRHMLEVFVNLGIGEALKAKTTQPPSGAQIADFLAAGRAEIGFQQISELRHAPGIRYLGPIPAELQSYTTYAAARHAGSAQVDAAAAFLRALRDPATQAATRAAGMEPL